ncbi:MAG: ABC transporter permease, partial [Acidobacteriia bacterium]|nr:ABC transporter permease [Terriglobia bacterium]
AVLTLALGIGANATVFTWLKAVVFNPLPGVEASDLVSIRWRTHQGNDLSFSWPDYLDYRSRAQSLQQLAVGRITAMSLGSGGQPERVWGALVSANYFDTMGVKPALGRAFTPDEDRNPGSHPVAVISHRLWETRFGADPAAVGREILLNKQKFTIIGVAPGPFQGSTLGLRFDLWVPAMMQQAIFSGAGSLDQRGSHWLEGWARLKPGVSPARAQAELTTISAQLTRELHKSDDFSRAIATPVWRDGGGRVLAPVMFLLMSVVGVVLLIACANLSNLLLARSAGRSREIAIRLALGVSRGRLIRLLLVENGLIAILGCAAAFAAVPAATGLLAGFMPSTDLPIALVANPDAGVFLFGLGVSLLATLLFGLLPALRASRPQIVDALKDDGSGAAGARRTWLRNSLVVTQVSLSLVLLIAAGLLLKSLNRARAADPGFDPRNVLVAGIDLLPNGYDVARGRVALRQMTEKISALPGVAAVSTIRRLPLSLAGTSSAAFTVEGYVPAKDEEMIVYTHVVGPDYFHTMNTPLIAGRDFAPSDTDSTQHVVVVNQTFARRYFSKSNPLGQRVRRSSEWLTVVGVAKDSKFQSLDEPAAPSVFFPVTQSFASEVNFLVRTTGDPTALARPVEQAVHALDPSLPLYGLQPLEDSIGVSFFAQRMGGSLLGFFGALALGLAAVGMYAVLAYSVAQRKREMAIRMAIGASRAGVLRLVLGQGLKLAGVGLAVGLGLAIAVTRLLRSLLFGVSTTDVPTIAAVSALLLLVICAASLLPALRATRIDPITAIRGE